MHPPPSKLDMDNYFMNVIKTSRLKNDRHSTSRFKIDKKMNEDLDTDNNYDGNVYDNSYTALALNKTTQ